MLRVLVQGALHYLDRLNRRWYGSPVLPSVEVPAAAPVRTYRRLERIVLTDSVARTLFEGFAAHRNSDRGEEEIGWVLLGVREERQAVALATLPAGTLRQAGVAHVQFNSDAQGLAARMVRHWDRRLVTLGVVHTHPGSLSHPSDGDFRGDSQWVGQLAGGEGVFGIGIAGGRVGRGHANGSVQGNGAALPHRQVLGELCFSWYALAKGQGQYRPLPVELTLGPDLARPLHPLWAVLEDEAQALDRLCRQQTADFEVVERDGRPTLVATLPLAEPDSNLKVLLDGHETQYVLEQEGNLSLVDPDEPRLDRAIYLILAELCAPRARKARGTPRPFQPKEKNHGFPSPR